MSKIDRLNRAKLFFDRLALNSDQWQDSPTEHLPLTHFLAAISIVLQGVMVMDGKVHWTEKQLIDQILQEFWTENKLLEQQILKFLEHINVQKIYLDPEIFKHLSDTLVEQEKCLILALGCSLALIDGYLDPRENLYLQSIAQRLNISLETFDLIQSSFHAPETIDPQRSVQLERVLSPDILGETAPPLRKIALDVLSTFQSPSE